MKLTRKIVNVASSLQSPVSSTGNWQLATGSWRKTGQTMIEYIIVLGVVVIVFFAMTPLIRRASQGMIKVVADQVGTQQGADQDFSRTTGFLANSETITQVHINQATTDILNEIKYTYDDAVTTKAGSNTNLGFTPNN